MIDITIDGDKAVAKVPWPPGYSSSPKFQEQDWKRTPVEVPAVGFYVHVYSIDRSTFGSGETELHGKYPFATLAEAIEFHEKLEYRKHDIFTALLGLSKHSETVYATAEVFEQTPAGQFKWERSRR